MNLVLLFLELFILFITSRYIFKAIFYISRKILKKDEWAMIPVFILFLPGTIIHELAHFIVAELFFVKAYDLEVAPRLSHGSLQMGSVSVAQSDIVRRMLIGVAPIFAGVIVLFSSLLFYTKEIGFVNAVSSPVNFIITSLVVWVCFFTSNTMFSSKKDLEGALELGAVILFVAVIIAFVLFLLKINPLPAINYFLLADQKSVVESLRSVVVLLSIPVGINILIFILSRIILRKFY